MIILTALRAVPEVLEELGADAAQVLAAAGIDPKDLREPGATVPYAAMGRLLSQCVAATGCPHFGLLAGAREGLSELGLVGFLARHSPTIGHALRNLVAFMHHYQRGGAPTLLCDGDVTRLGYTIYHPHVESAEQVYDGAMAVCSNALRTLCGPEWAPLEVAFCHASPAELTPYEQVFEAPLRFDAPETFIAFPTQWLARPVSGADPMLYRILQQQVNHLTEGSDTATFRSTVRGMARSLLLMRRCSANEVAALFGVHRRTLHRHLKAEGVTFEGLVEEVRSDLALELLADGHMPLSQVSAALGYADASAFSRAFQRWFGESPTHWRARQGPPGEALAPSGP
jgi:AraC-like DNA-binding protein